MKGITMTFARNLLFSLAALFLMAALVREQAVKAQGGKPKPAISEKEVSLMKALDSTMKVSIKGQPMKDVLEWLEDKTKGDLSIIVDEQGIKDVAEELLPKFLNDPVTKEYKKQKVRTLLRIILKERGMGYYIEDGSLIITKDAKALNKMVVKSYPVANLVGGQQLSNAAIMNPMGPNGQLLSQNIDALTNQIMGNLETDYWKVSGSGPGTMQFVPATASLQVRASLEVQFLLMASGLLENKQN
jgi:hypothetical protein